MDLHFHLDRHRAESFGTAAALYDRYRPTYPEALVDDLAALRPAAVLDVGCGTGKVARSLAARGLAVTGIDPDGRMADVARSHGITVEVATLESWDDRGRRFDLVTCGACWHWIHPEVGTAKAATVLRSGGTLARFYHYEIPEEPALAAIESVYQRLAPKATRYVQSPPEGFADPVRLSPAFSGTETRTYESSRVLTAAEWVGMASTFSDHRRMEPGLLAALREALTDAIERIGGNVYARGGAQLLLSHRA